jgi:hypothetical protein
MIALLFVLIVIGVYVGAVWAIWEADKRDEEADKRWREDPARPWNK